MGVVVGPRSVRVYVRGRRLHHGRTGSALAILGAALMLHDRRDFPWSFFDERTRRAR